MTETHEHPWFYEGVHTSSCDEGPNHPGPCHPQEQAATMSIEAATRVHGPRELDMDPPLNRTYVVAQLPEGGDDPLEALRGTWFDPDAQDEPEGGDDE